MKVLFATTNPAKVTKYHSPLAASGIELLTIKDLDFQLSIEENGSDAIANARIKAQAYYDATHLPTIGMDNTLFIEELPADQQPGTHVKRIDGRELTDAELIAHYINLVKSHGGQLTAKWVYGLTICDDHGHQDFSWSTSPFYLITQPSSHQIPSYPLDSISIIPEFNKCLTELTDTELRLYQQQAKTDADIHFLLTHLPK